MYSHAKINDTIFFLSNNKIVSSKVVAKMTVENAPPYENENERDGHGRVNYGSITNTTPFGHPSGTTYATQNTTQNNVVKAENAFASKEELLASL